MQRARTTSPIAIAGRIPTLNGWPGVAILFAFFLMGVHAARLRPFWFDELSTLFVTNTLTIREMFRAIPTDGNPPLYFLLARLSLHLHLGVELALRLPALLAYLLAALTVYWFVRRDASRIYALLSMSMFLGCSIHRYAIEARAYSLLMAFTGITICSWQYYRQSGRRRALVGISLGVIGAIFTHQYGVIYSTLPLIAGEFVRALRRRVLDRRVLYALAIPALAILLTYPPTLRAQQSLLSAIHACPGFYAHPRLRDLKVYAEMVPPFFALLAVLACVGLLFKLALIGPPPGRSPPPPTALLKTLPLRRCLHSSSRSCFSLLTSGQTISSPVMALAPHWVFHCFRDFFSLVSTGVTRRSSLGLGSSTALPSVSLECGWPELPT